MSVKPVSVIIKPSTVKTKKKTAIFTMNDGTRQTVNFGQAGSSDYTKHKDPQRKEAYIARHSKEDWSKTNIASPAWMSRYILWEKPTLKGAVDNANKKYKDVKFILKYFE